MKIGKIHKIVHISNEDTKKKYSPSTFGYEKTINKMIAARIVLPCLSCVWISLSTIQESFYGII